MEASLRQVDEPGGPPATEAPARPTVSVIIPAYKASRTIARALASLMAQERPADEVLVIDDGSPDGDELAAEVGRFAGPIRLIRQANGGAARARNAGIEAGRGDLISFLDADDYWEPAKLRRQIEVLEAHPEVGLVAGRFYLETPGEPRQLPARLPPFEAAVGRVIACDAARAFELATMIWTTSVLVRREVLGDHRFVPGLEPAEDRDLWFRLVASAPAFLLAEPLATYVQESGSLSRSSIDFDCGNMLRVVRRHAPTLGRRVARHWEADTHRRWGAVHLSQRRPRRALRHVVARLVREPLSPEGWYVLGKVLILSAMRSTAASTPA